MKKGPIRSRIQSLSSLTALDRRGYICLDLCKRAAFRSMKYLRTNFPWRAGNGALHSWQLIFTIGGF